LLNEARIREAAQAGREEGREEGRRHAVEVNLRQLQSRLRTLPATLVAQVSQLPLTSLDALSLALLDFTSQADLQTWLEQQS
jgi:predicted transposase YdaD